LACSAVLGIVRQLPQLQRLRDAEEKYQTAGRNQTEAEAVELDKRIRALFDGRIDIEVEGKSDAVDQVYDALMALA
jgi:hypothetical protein